MLKTEPISAPRQFTIIRPDRIRFPVHADFEPFERPSHAVIVTFSFVFSITLHLAILSLLAGGHGFFGRGTPVIEVDLTEPYEIVAPDLTMLSKPVRKGRLEGTAKNRIVELVPGYRRNGVSAKHINTDTPTPRYADTLQNSPIVSVSQDTRRRSPAGPENATAEFALVSLTALPRLKNAADLAGILRKYYPESERLAGHEARVVLDLHITASGEVARAEIAQSAGPAFDRAALQAARVLRFQPARVGLTPVPVKLRQTIAFRLN